MEPYTNETQAAIERAIRKFLNENKELTLRRILGLEGLDIEAAEDKDININTYGTGKALYNGMEIGAGGITGSGTINYIPRFTGASAIGDSHLIDDGTRISSSEDIQMLNSTKTEYFSDIKTGAIFSKKVAIEAVDYYGIQVTPYNTHETFPGNLFIGDTYAAPSGAGILITDTGIYLAPVGAYDVKILNSIMFQGTEGGQLGRSRLQNASSPPSIDKGGIYYDTNSPEGAKLNKGTYASPDWQPLGGGTPATTVTDETTFGIAKTVGALISYAREDHTHGSPAHDKAAHDALAIDHGSLSGLSDDDHPQYALLAAANIFTANKQYLLGAGGSETNYPQWLMQNTTYGAAYYSVLRLNDLGMLELKSAEGSVLSMGSFSATGSVTASTQLISSVVTGTPPLSVASTTMVTNLNADTVDGIHAAGLGAVTSVFGRTGAVVAATNDYTWAQINKATSSLGDITTKDHHLLSGLSDNDHPQYAQLAADNIFTGNKQYVLGAGGSQTNYPQILFRNTTYASAYYTVLELNDAGRLVLKSAEGSIISNGTFIPAVTTSLNLGGASNYWNYGYIKNIYMNDGVLDFRTDNIHRIAYISGTNSLDIQSYQTINLKTTYDSGTPLSAAQDGVRIQEALFIRKNHAADNCYITDDASGTMELHVPSGQKLKVIIG